jgi:hypothetical protein
MNKIILSFALLFACSVSQAQSSDRYVKAMTANIAAMDSSFRNPVALAALGSSFERIALAEKTAWIPYYYAAFCQVNVALMENKPSQNDDMADKAEMLVNKADSLSPNNSEISCLRSMIATCRMLVNPMSRFMEYAPVSESALAQAIKLDPTNPRPHLLKGQTLKYTPEQFGGGCKTAMPELTTAVEKFESFKPAVPFAPDWGKALANNLVKSCQ